MFPGAAMRALRTLDVNHVMVNTAIIALAIARQSGRQTGLIMVIRPGMGP